MNKPIAMRLVPVFSLGLALSLAGCAVDSAPSSNAADSDSIVVGDVAGQDLIVHEAIALRVDGDDAHGVAIVLTDRPGVCAALQHGAALGATTTLTLFVPEEASNAGSTSSSTHVLSAELPASTLAKVIPAATLSTRDASCDAPLDTHGASRGHIELDQIALASGQRTFGSFDLEFGSDALVGKFAAVYCDLKGRTSDPLAEAQTCQ